MNTISQKAKVHFGVTKSLSTTPPKTLKIQSLQYTKNLPCLSSPTHNTQTMSSFTNPTTLFHAQITTTKNHNHNHHHYQSPPKIQATISRRKTLTTCIATSVALGLSFTPLAMAEKWGARSFIWEKFFEPDLSPEDSAARIRQTAEGLHSLREMLETMSWRYVLFYIRLKAAYLSKDMKNALAVVPQSRRKSYVDTANQLVDNMAEFDYYIRTPKVYESYVYYEKTLKSIDDLVALLA